MPDINIPAVLVATIVVFIVGATFYALVGNQLATVSEAAATGDRFPPWKAAAELLRSLILVAVIAGLASQTRTDDWAGGLLLGFALWVGFPFVLWTGAMLHERTPWKLAAIHGGDWLIKVLLVAVIVSVWR